MLGTTTMTLMAVGEGEEEAYSRSDGVIRQG